jgi:hypothetical protein
MLGRVVRVKRLHGVMRETGVDQCFVVLYTDDMIRTLSKRGTLAVEFTLFIDQLVYYSCFHSV